ncbi:MAG TPA: hypothetical protein VHU19_14380 [Pyrinomonadaceae bacterium]|jgi:hypothetical protein|nr:hypothetical protein [Pyrinomonadaceae bacterium]
MPEKLAIDTTELEDLIADGKSVKEAAEEMGIHATTLYQRSTTDQEVKGAITRGQARARADGNGAGATANGNGTGGPHANAQTEPTARRKGAKKAGGKKRGAVKAAGAKKQATRMRKGAAQEPLTAPPLNNYGDALEAAYIELLYVRRYRVSSERSGEVIRQLEAARATSN